MEFGKVYDISTVDFSLAPDDIKTTGVLKKATAATAFQKKASTSAGGGVSPFVAVGSPTWTQKKWIGTIYPKGLESKNFLKTYSEQFTCIELNTTYYRIPDLATVERWHDTTAPDFTFCPKFPQSISHSGDLLNQTANAIAFCEVMLHLKKKLGTTFLQLPPQFSPTEFGSLLKFFSSLPPEFPVAVELRHPGFFGNRNLREIFFSNLANRGISTVITDVAGRRDLSHSSLTTPTAFIRFIGNALDPTDYSRLDDWVLKIENWIKLGLEKIYFICHEPDDLTSPEIIKYFSDKINQHCGLDLRVWSPKVQGTQLGLF